MSDDTEGYAQFKGKVTYAFKNDMRNLANMHRPK